MAPNTHQKMCNNDTFIYFELSKPLEPCVVPATMAEPTLEWNYHRRAKAELGLYLALTSEPYLQSTESDQLDASNTPQYNHYEESEDSMSFGDDIPPHLYNPRPLPLIQQLRNWWRYRQTPRASFWSSISSPEGGSSSGPVTNKPVKYSGVE
ncbi:hypothetical protein VP01_2571g1 [Puccinia sorghi]|uniref:Uncharacterized protein n=1 Tax=Puccinia sorghi TaxID=27349 RepID=A0A0L6V6S2_9BASI|nr:hypothetical protein VP01_2571g1 [Puccinia sorghi]